MKRCAKLCIFRFLCALFLAVVIFSFTALKSSADENGEYSLIIDDTEELIEDFNSSLPDGFEKFENISDVSDAIGFEFLLRNIATEIKGERGEFFSFFLLLFGLSLLLSLADNIEGEMGSVCKNAVSLVCALVLFGKMFVLVKNVCVSLEEINAFFSAMIPIAAAVNLLGLSTTTATIQSFGMNMTLQIYSALGIGILPSFVGALLAMSAVSSFDNSFLGGMTKSIKHAFMTFIGILTTLIGATFSLQNVISSYADTGVIRTAKYALSGMIPIVGSTVSGAFSTLAGGISYAKGVIGGGAIAVIVAVMIAPLVTLLMYRLCFGVAVFFSEMSSHGGFGMLSSFSSVLDTLIATYTLTGVIYIVQLAVFLKGGASLV